MRQQGRCTLPTDDAGRVMDRLAGLEQVIPPYLQRHVLRDTGRVNVRSCRLTHEVMLWVVLAMGLFTDAPIRHVFQLGRRFRMGEKTPARSSLCDARRRLGVEPLRELHRRVVRPLATADTPGAFYRGRRWVAFDGTTFDAPDTPANRLAFHRAQGGRGEGAFPQVRKVSLVELGTHAELALAVGGWQDAETTLARQLIEYLPADALLALDRGFYSYDLWETLDRRGIALLMRVKSHMVFQPIRRLSDGSYLAKVYACSDDRRYDRRGIVVRVIEYTLDDPRRVGHGQTHRLITNLLDEQECPALEVVCGSHERWEIEATYDEQKTHQDPVRAGKPAHLRSETPVGVHQEVWALSLAHFVTRALMAAAAAQPEPIDPDRLSFTGCLRVLRLRLPELARATPAAVEEWYRHLLWELRRETIPPRRNRVNPRVVKRKMSKFAKKRAEHRHPPPLTKTFAETVVIT